VFREILRARLHEILHAAGGEHELIAYGIMLVLVMIFLPEGLTTGSVNLYHRWKARRAAEAEMAREMEPVLSMEGRQPTR